MSLDPVHVGDIGTPLRVKFVNEAGSVIDISSASTKEIKIKGPTGATVTKTGVFTTDGSDGYLEYVTAAAGDIDEAGQWQIQGRVVLPSSTWSTKVRVFEVEANL